MSVYINTLKDRGLRKGDSFKFKGEYWWLERTYTSVRHGRLILQLCLEHKNKKFTSEIAASDKVVVTKVEDMPGGKFHFELEEI
jgi:hypothetical protein